MLGEPMSAPSWIYGFDRASELVNHLGLLYACRKPTHTDTYLHYQSNHHLRQKRVLIKTLTDRALRISEPLYLKEGLEHVCRCLEANGYPRKFMKRVIRPKSTWKNTDKDLTSVGMVMLLYVNKVMDHIEYFRSIIQIPTKKMKEHLRTAKDSRDSLVTAGVYRIRCSCSRVYIGTTREEVSKPV